MTHNYIIRFYKHGRLRSQEYENDYWDNVIDLAMSRCETYGKGFTYTIILK